MFKLVVDATQYGEFTRAKRESGADAANRFLDRGNYLAYGLCATAPWVSGLPHDLAVLHGRANQRRAHALELPAAKTAQNNRACAFTADSP